MFALRQILPIILKVGSPKFWRKVVEWLPIPRIQDARSIIDVMHNTSLEIYSRKLDGLKKGDKTVMEQMGNGKDIMSILRTHPEFLLSETVTKSFHIYYFSKSECRGRRRGQVA